MLRRGAFAIFSTTIFNWTFKNCVSRRGSSKGYMWNRLRFIRYLPVSEIFQRRKSAANKQDFENMLTLTCRAQSTPKTTGILTKVFSTSGPNFGGLNLNGWWVIARTSSKWVKFWRWSEIWPLSSVNHPQSNRDLNQGHLHLWSKFGDPSLNGWWVIARTNLVTDWRTDGRTDGRRQWRPILASGKKNIIRANGDPFLCWHMASLRHIE